jgi:hypothetical protein
MKRDLERQDGYCLTTSERRESDRGKQIIGTNVTGGGQAEKLCSDIRTYEEMQCPSPKMTKMQLPIEEVTVNGVKRSFLNMCYNNEFGSRPCHSEKDLQMLKATIPRLSNFPVEKSIYNCTVYKKVNIDKDLTYPADYTDGNGNKIA